MEGRRHRGGKDNRKGGAKEARDEAAEVERREKEGRRGLTARESNVRENKGGHERGKRLERWSRTEGREQ